MPFFSHGFVSSGFLNLTASEAYTEATENNAILLDVREERLTGYKNFNVPNVIKMPNSTICILKRLIALLNPNSPHFTS